MRVDEIRKNATPPEPQKLFAVMVDAVEALENNEPIAARKVLIAAMQEAEEIVISAEEG